VVLGAGFLILVGIACFWFWLEMDNGW